MKVAIMQPYFFPYIGYFHLMSSVDLFIIHDDIQYVKNSWINRNRILADENVKWLTAPVVNDSYDLAINRRVYVSDTKTRRGISNRIRGSYARAPFFKNVNPIIENLIAKGTSTVSEFNQEILMDFSSRFGLNLKVLFSSKLEKDNSLRGQDRVLDICRRVGASTYINAPGGVSLYDSDAFASHGIELRFIQPRAEPYKQFGDEFHPWLSIIDVLMFTGFRGAADQLRNFDLLDPATGRREAAP